MNKKANSRMRLEGGGKGIATEGLEEGGEEETRGGFSRGALGLEATRDLIAYEWRFPRKIVSMSNEKLVKNFLSESGICKDFPRGIFQFKSQVDCGFCRFPGLRATNQR